MIPFFMIPSGIVSLEVGFRLLNAATPKMSTVVQYLLQSAYTLMIPARLLMFAALMHAISRKEIIFCFIILRATLELSINISTLDNIGQYFSANDEIEESSGKKGNSLPYMKLAAYFSLLSKSLNYPGAIWRICMFSIRDVFAISIRESPAYMKRPSNVTYHSIRSRISLIKRCLIFLLEGLVGAWIIEEFYPCAPW